jgi:hypothetical protein
MSEGPFSAANPYPEKRIAVLDSEMAYLEAGAARAFCRAWPNQIEITVPAAGGVTPPPCGVLTPPRLCTAPLAEKKLTFEKF